MEGSTNFPYTNFSTPDYSFDNFGAPLTQNFSNPNPLQQPEEPVDESLNPLWMTLIIVSSFLVLGAIIFVIIYFTRPGEDARTLPTESLSTADEITTGPQVWIKDCNQQYVNYGIVGEAIVANQSVEKPLDNGWTFVRQSTFDNEYKDLTIADGSLKYPNADALGMLCWIRNENDEWLGIGSAIEYIPVITICDNNDLTDCLSMTNGFSFQSFGSFDGTSLNLTTTVGKHIFISRDANAVRPDPEDTDLGLYRVLCWNTLRSMWEIYTYNIPDPTDSDPYPIKDGQNLITGAQEILDWATDDNASYGVPGDVAGYTTTLSAAAEKYPIELFATQSTAAPFRVNPVGIRTFFWETNTTTRMSVQNDLEAFQSISAYPNSLPLLWLVEPIDEVENSKLFDGQERYKNSLLADIGAFKTISAPTE